MGKEKYALPIHDTKNYRSDRDGTNQRILNIIEILEEVPMDSLSTFLDIGMGNGQVTKWLSKKGKKCTGTGLELESYALITKELKENYDIDTFECGIESMPFPDKSFDAILMSHILEHCVNPGRALDEARRVLKDDGKLFIFMPPHEDYVVAGHVSVGWNMGQLLYTLIVNGFDAKHGKFIKYNYNICGVVGKNDRPLPELRGDHGDIHILNKESFFPLPIKTRDGLNDGFYANIKAINWYPDSKLLQKISRPAESPNKLTYMLKVTLFEISKYIPERAKDVLSILLSNRKSDVNNIVNPTELLG